jgi:uncharacterized protein YifN (PemK superfamily)
LKENTAGLKFQPRLRAVVTCDYTGFVEPEMVKVRSVVVFAKSRTRSRRGGRAIYHSTLSIAPHDYFAIQRGVKYDLGLEDVPVVQTEVLAT